MSITYKVENKVGWVEFDMPDSRVNILTGEVLREFDLILNKVKADGSLTALVIRSAKKDIFIAGADIKEIEGITEPKAGEEKSKAGQDIFNKLEDLPLPKIAVIDGAVLGGGCELILACDYRVATFNEAVKIGLPEVTLGIIPGFGGTYRLPRLIGLEQALSMILTGKTQSCRTALRLGLVDRVFPQKGLNQFLEEFLEGVKGSRCRIKSFNWKPKGIRAVLLNRTLFGHLILLTVARKNVFKENKENYPAPLKAIEVIRKTLDGPRDQALSLEAREFSHLAVTDVSKNLVHLYHLSTRFKKLNPPAGASRKPMDIKKCAVLGAGVMGGGIAQLLSYKDITPRIKDINYEAIAQGLRSAAYVFHGGVKRRKLTRAEAEMKMGRITGTVDYSGFGNVDCVIEAVVEDMDIKKKVFAEASRHVPSGTLLCTNTSALSVTDIARAAGEPHRVIGFHFFNPVHRMPLVEIITTEYCQDQTVADALALAKRLGKTPILVKDRPGFLVNRILLRYINEAGYLLEEGAGMLYLDEIMKDFGMPMGPVTLSDEVGLDVGYKVLKILHAGLGDRFQPAKIFETLFEKKLLGKKANKGFYIHKGKKRIPNSLIATLATRKNDGADLSRETCRDRMIFVMVDEAARCLEDGIVDDAAAVDIGMIMGTGFPAFRGGLLKYADAFGLDNIYDVLKLMETNIGPQRFTPSQYLKELRNQSKKFYSS